MRRHVLALIGAVALAAPLLAVTPAQAAQLAPRDVPGAPDKPTVEVGTLPGQVRVDWADNWNGLPEISDYVVQVSEFPDLFWEDYDNTGSPDTELVVSGLTQTQLYVFRVAAINDDGTSVPSAASDPIYPKGGAPAPTNLSVTRGERSLTLSWTAPSPAPGSYDVQIREARLGAKWLPEEWRPVPAGTTAARFTDLDPAKSYYMRVRSNNGGVNVSDPVETDAAVSPLAAPGAPTNLRAAAGDAQVVLTWTAPDLTPDSYQVQYRVDGSSTWQPSSPLPANNGTTYTVTGLTNGTPYFFQVRSVRGSLVSSWTETTAAVAPNGAWAIPADPTAVTASPSNQAAFVYWDVPAGNPATNYDLQYSTDGTNWSPATPIRTPSAARNYTLTGLANGIGYLVRVRTVNGPQVSPGWTRTAGVVVPVGSPGQPTSVTGVPGNNQVVLSWVPPAGPSSPVTGYRVQLSTNNGLTWTPVADLSTPATSVLVGGLTNGVGYIFRVQAKSQSGDGPWSPNSAVITPPGGPGAPTNVLAVAGNASATVGWTAPATSPGFPIVGYQVTSNPDGRTCTTSAVPPATPASTCVVSGLRNGQPYTFTVVAISNAGVGTPSAPSAAVTPVGGPNPPTGVTAVAGDRSATVSWTPPTGTAGGTVTSYRATSSPDGRACTVNAPATTCTVTGLTNGQAYTFTVVAISATGTSAPSAASAPVTPFTTQVTIRITDSSRNGGRVVISGTTQGLDPGDSLQVLTRTSAKGQFQQTAEIQVRSNGTFRWSGTSTRKTWIRVTDGDVVSNTVIVAAR